MGTTAQKLNKILETKEAIRTAINNKGGTLTTTDTFSSYPTAIDSLPSGGNDWLKELLDESKNASYLFCGYSQDSVNTTWYYNITYERLQNILSYNTTSNVTNMKGMFFYCSNLRKIPLINTSLVTDMSNMFNSCSDLRDVPQLNTSNVTNMSGMFVGCSSLYTIPQLDTSKVTNMRSMFAKCSYLSTIPQLDTSNVLNMYNMFQGCERLTTIPQLNTSKVTNMYFMFYNCYKLTKIDITHMNITSTSNSNYFAQNCYSLTKLIIRNMTTIPVISSSIFNNCYHFTGTTDATYNPQGLKDGRIYVPDDKVDALKTASGWSTYADIIVPLSTLQE